MNKTHIFPIIALLFASVFAYAQKPVIIAEDSFQIGNSMVPVLTVTIPEVDFDKTLKAWTKEQESGTKSKVITENGEMSIFGANKKEVSTTPVNIYSILQNQDTLQLLMVCFEPKKGEYIEPSSGDIQLTAARTYLKEFAKSQYIEFIKEEVAAEEKKLRGLENELNGLKKNESRTKKGSQKNKNVITNEQDKLIVKNNELNRLSNDIIEQNTILISMETGPGREAKSAEIKEMEKRKGKLQREMNKAENNIDKSKSQINQADRALPKNENEQDRMREKIEEQEAVVRRFMDKLNTVKNY
ncbi:MAG: hypothetical protein E4G92_02335 [Bacteroidia bacterium]|nr:MAG: hypothetical protein E4G92_02335 [Bacteroidia bacterium]